MAAATRVSGDIDGTGRNMSRSRLRRARANSTADQRILELAGDHLRRFGPRRTTIVGIAEAAGMSHANVYRYFPSKQALFEAVTALWLKPLEAQLARHRRGPGSRL